MIVSVCAGLVMLLVAIAACPARAQHTSIDPSMPFPPVLGQGKTFRGEDCGGDDIQFGHAGDIAAATHCVTQQGRCPLEAAATVGQACQCRVNSKTLLGCAK